MKIENNHRRADYGAFFNGELPPDYLRRGKNGAIYSIHAPGLPILLLPAYAIGGVRAAIVMMCLFGALAAVAVFDVAALLGGPTIGAGDMDQRLLDGSVGAVQLVAVSRDRSGGDRRLGGAMAGARRSA